MIFEQVIGGLGSFAARPFAGDYQASEPDRARFERMRGHSANRVAMERMRAMRRPDDSFVIDVEAEVIENSPAD